ncbi:MAG: hypothetical protein AAGM22_25740 [Acidobacteriota bacterium]
MTLGPFPEEAGPQSTPLTIENLGGGQTLSISNLEITAQTQNPSNRRQLLPVASLVPENPDLDEINIGALGDPARGPFVFTAVSVFPQQVEELMKNPRGLLVSLANFDITDEAGRSFSFISQDVLDRTAGLTFDLGDGRVESFRVATASVHDRQTGRPVGITVRYALEEILGLFGAATVRDGGDGVSATAAVGDDVQVVAVGAPVEPGEVVVTAGADGLLDSSGAGDDRATPADYETARPQGNQILDGGDGVADSVAVGDDEQVVAPGDAVVPGGVVIAAGADGVLESAPAGDDEVAPESGAVLTRFRDVETLLEDDAATPDVDERRRFWVLYTSKDLPENADLENVVLRSGDELSFAFVQDQDGDGVTAREEFLHGSSDLFANTDGCPPQDACAAAAVPDRTEPPMEDGLSDAEEIQEGWRVQLAGAPQSFPVFPNPVQGDSDRDFLTDGEERACALDPRQRDTDLDGLSDWEELTGQRLIDGEIVQMVSRDPDTDAIVFTILPYTGDGEGPLLFHESLPDCDALAGIQGFATDPLNPDTDGDSVSDFAELQLGIHPNNPFDGGDFLDDDGDGVSNNREQAGFSVGLNCGPAAPPSCIQTFTSNPNDPDSDDDTLPDLLEHFIGSNPLSADTDGDGLADNDEYRGQGEACLTIIPGQPCVLFSSLIDNDFLQFVARCLTAPNCDYDEATLLAGREQYGTNMNESDSDFDLVLDGPELLDDLMITVNGGQQVLPAPASDPLLADTDGEGLADAVERAGGTDPRRADTDVDSVDDFREGAIGTDPRTRDRRLDFAWESLVLTVCDDGAADSFCEIEGRWRFQTPDTSFVTVLQTSSVFTLPVDTNLLFFELFPVSPAGPFVRTDILLDGQSVRVVSDSVEEVDGFSNDDIPEIDETFTLSCDGFGCTLDRSGLIIVDQNNDDGVVLRSTLNVTLQQ